MSPHSSSFRLDDIKFSSKKSIPKIILGVIVFALVTFGGANLLNAIIGSVNAVEGEEGDTAIVIPEGGKTEEDEEDEKDGENEEGKEDKEDKEDETDPPAAGANTGANEDTSGDTNAVIADAIYQSLDNLPKNGIDHSLDRVINTGAESVATSDPLLHTLRSDNLPAYYNSREQAFASQIRTKNQNTEGLCWAYSGASVLEYGLAKRGIYTTVSPKHIDYQMVAASDAYKESDVAAGATNLYNDRTVAALQAGDVETPQRNLGDGGNVLHILMAWANPLSIMSEADFASAIKNSDSSISSIAEYSDIWGIDGAQTSILTDGIYTVKQNYTDINNADATNMVVSEAKYINASAGESESKMEVVNSIKNAIQTYGAVEVATYYDTSSLSTCGKTIIQTNDDGSYYVDEDGHMHVTHIIIDRSTSIASSCPSDSGHAVTLVGWDDNFTYTDANEEKTGAFIVQNSYGDVITEESNQGPVSYILTDYMTYSSALNVVVFSGLESTTEFDHNYTAEDYQTPTLTAGDYDLIYEFNSNGKEQLKEFSYITYGYSSISNDIYVSNTGNAEDFVQVGTLKATSGINKFEFESPVIVNGKFAIKVTQKGATIDNMDRAANVLTLRTDDYAGEDPIPDDPTDPTDPDDPDDPTDPDNPTDPDEKSSNAYLASIEVRYKVNGEEKTAELEPEFNKDVIGYEVVIPEGFDEAVYEDGASSLIVATLEDEKATAVAETEALAAEVTITTITVTAEDETTTKEYTVIVYYGEAPEVPDTSAPDGKTPSAPNTGFMVKRKDGDATNNVLANIALSIAVLSIVLFALLVFFHKYKITKRSHLKGKIDLL